MTRDYRLVPLEPTEEMVRIATAEYVQSCSRRIHPNIAWRRAFQAMIAAAPNERSEYQGDKAMIKVIDINHRVHILNPIAVSQVIEAGNSGKWHGINCYVKLFDGTTIEVQESVDQVLQMLSASENNL